MLWFRLASLFMLMAVALGAFGAHALKNKLSADMLAIFETGVRYQVYHALSLFFVSWLSQVHLNSFVTAAGWAFTFGIFIFSGSLYILSLSGIRWWGAITPIGGLSLLVGWLLIFLSSFKN